MRLDILAPAGSRSQTNRLRPGGPRTGFTLVELMVAMALSLFLMSILAEAFAVSMDTFRGLRAIGDMQDTLRNGLRQMRDDLSLPHFEGNRKLSDNGFWMEPRREGFFYMKGSAPTSEGLDGNNLQSSRATDHVMHFAVRKQGFRPPDYFTVGPFATTPPINPAGSPPSHYVPANNPLETFYGNLNPSTNTAYISSQWAEVAYLMRPMPPATTGGPAPTTPETTATGTPITLYNLYRAQVLMLPYRDGVQIQSITTATTGDLQPGSAYLTRMSESITNFLSPNDVALSTSRGFNPNAANPNANQVSLVCTNVISFQVRLLVQQRAPGISANDSNIVKEPIQSTVYLDDMKNYIFSTNPNDPAIDTSTATLPNWAVPNANGPPLTAPLPLVPPPLRIMGVQIRLRVYDPASGQARQNTIVQAL